MQTPFLNTMMAGVMPDGSGLLVGEFHHMNKQQAQVWLLPLPAGAPRRLGDLVVQSLTPLPRPPRPVTVLPFSILVHP